jgi:hypothetical protein
MSGYNAAWVPYRYGLLFPARWLEVHTAVALPFWR